MKKKRTECDLMSCLFCRAGQEAWRSDIKANRKTLYVKRGDLIFGEGSPVAGIYFIDKGIVKIHQQWTAQRQLVVNFAQSGEMIGYRGLGNEPIFPVSATALVDSFICYFELSFFESTLTTNPHLTYVLMKFFVNALQQAEKRMRNLALMDVKGRVADTLLMLLQKFGIDEAGFIACKLSRQDMAGYAGTTYETFFRMLQALKADCLIEQTGKSICIRDPSKLASLTQISVG